MTPAQDRTPNRVTDETLRKPSPSDWLHWRGNSQSWGYSPLNQITVENVGTLQLAWAWQMEAGNQQAAPVVHNGVMFLPSPGGTVHALNAATGDLLWSTATRSREERAKVPRFAASVSTTTRSF